MKYTIFNTISVILIIILFISSCRSKTWSQDIMADESEKQTKLMQEQVKQLKRIADALQKDTTKVNPYIYHSNP